MKKRLLPLLLTLCLALSAALPVSALELEDARELLDYYYVDPIPEEVLALDSLDAILEALGDPYTVYMNEEEYQNFLSSVNGESVVGIGVSVESTYRDGYQVMSVLPKSPALEAGLEAGDRIVAVNGVAASASTDIRTQIGGEEGTPVTITVIRKDGSTRDFVMNRRKVDIPIITYEKAGHAGFIDCISFGESTAPTVREALETLDGQVNAWVMDLRDNPGGTSRAAADAAGLFAGDEIQISFLDSFGNSMVNFTTSPDLTDKPLIILTSPYSASGSELFAAAIRDFGAGIAVGQRTFGKGIAQFVLDETNTRGCFDGDCLKITAYRFYSPDGATNHTVGVLPTLTVSPENAEAAALLLTCAYSDFPENHLRIDLAGQTLAVNMGEALETENRAAFTELLEALPPSAGLRYSTGKNWDECEPVAPAALAQELGLEDFSPRTFSDLSGSPFRREIDTLAVHQLLGGYEDGTFRPERTVTRAEFAAMVSTALNLPEGKTGGFSDVAEGDWFAGAVSGMAARGFLAGYGDGTFRPQATITYQEMVTVLASVAAWANIDAAKLAAENVPISEYPDYHQFSAWAQAPARVLNKLNALVGDQAPGDSGTRQTAAGLLCTLMENIHLIWD